MLVTADDETAETLKKSKLLFGSSLLHIVDVPYSFYSDSEISFENIGATWAKGHFLFFLPQGLITTVLFVSLCLGSLIAGQDYANMILDMTKTLETEKDVGMIGP